MQKTFTTLVLSIFILSAFATVRTVSNNPGTLAQFNQIQDAVNASANGDTVYVHGSPNIYNTFSLDDKNLTIIGPGWAPDKAIGLQAIVNGCSIKNTAAAGSPSNSEFQGLIFSNQFIVGQFSTNELVISNLKLIRCQFNSVVSIERGFNNSTIEGCLFLTSVNFNTSTASGASNILFQNNLFFANQCCTGAGISGLINNISNVLFDHNLFYSDGNVLAFGNNCQFLTLSNNIFVKRNPATNLSNSTFTNNITYLCGAFGDSAFIRNGNTGTGNIAATNPQMADQVRVEAGTFSGLLDFTIASGPANNAGTDGKDLGLLYDPTGSLNWANSRNSRLPRIFNMNVVTPTVASGGDISVQIEARKSN